MRSIIFAWIFKRPIAWVAMMFIAIAVTCNFLVISICEGMIEGFIGKARKGNPDFILSHYSGRYSVHERPNRYPPSERYDEESFDKHIDLVNKIVMSTMSDSGETFKEVKASKQLYTMGLIKAKDGDEKSGTEIRGVSPENFATFFDESETDTVLSGDVFADDDPEDDVYPMVISHHASLRLGLFRGAEAELHFLSPRDPNGLLGGYETKTVKAKVNEILDFNGFSKWNKAVFFSKADMQVMMNRHDDYAEVSDVFLKVPSLQIKNASSIGKSFAFERYLNKELNKKSDLDYYGGSFAVTSYFWNQDWLLQNIADITNVKVIVVVVLLMAGFATYLLIHLMMKEKVKIMGLLMAMGVSNTRIFFSVMFYGLVISLIGSALGWLGGYQLVKNLESVTGIFGIRNDMFGKYGFPTFPKKYSIDLFGEEFALGGALAVAMIILTVMCSMIPAIVASRIQPAIVLKSTE